MMHLRVSILGMLLPLSVALFAHAEESGDEIAPPGMVRVEPTELVPPKAPDHDFTLKDYAARREHWGGQFGLAFNSYFPGNYAPQFIAQNYSSVYNDFATSPLLEIQGVVKRNFDWGAVGVEFAFGSYSNSSKGSAQVDSTLALQQYRIGVIYIDEMMMKNRYVAPYISAGAYVMMFDESQAAVSFQGNTQLAPYVTFGAQFSLDWMDPVSARLAYESAYVQSTYVFAEVRKYFASSNSTDPDFESGFVPGLGLRLEF